MLLIANSPQKFEILTHGFFDSEKKGSTSVSNIAIGYMKFRTPP
jgi:hypothetical protein